MKKMTKTLWVFLLMLGCLLGTGHVLAATPTQPAGAGTQEDPYQISTTDELFWFAGLVNGTLTDGTTKNTAACAKLTADITIPDGQTWTPIGSLSTRYTGTFDGAGHTIEGLVINKSDNYQGFVGYLEGGTIQNLMMGETCSVTTKSFVGGVCGHNNFGTIINCYNSGTVEGSTGVGGVCGCNRYGTITNCYNSGMVKGSGSYVGGVNGDNFGTITNCYNSGTVKGGGSEVGGVCGYNLGTITNCYWSIGTANTGIGFGGGSATSKTATKFASGEVAYLLNGSTSEGVSWFQTLGEDDYPVLDSSRGIVYAEQYCDGTLIGNYGNSSKIIHTGFNGNGLCACGQKYQPAELNGNVYEISNAGQLFWFAALVNGTLEGTAQNAAAGAVLTTNIDLSDKAWTPIGNASTIYTGTFDGAGHTISDMKIENATGYSGLFGNVTGTVRDFTVDGTITVNTTATDLKVGGAVGSLGTASAGGTVSGVTSKVNITVTSGKGHIGGVVGSMMGDHEPKVENCLYTGNIKYSADADCVAGVVAYIRSGHILNCANRGTVSVNGTGGVGGILGYGNNKEIYIRSCYSTGNVTGSGTGTVGAIVGNNKINQADITNCCYLTGSAAKGQGQLDTDAAGTVVKSADDFKSGAVCWLLNGSTGENVSWYQTLGQDELPVLDNTHGKVYQDGSSYSNILPHDHAFSADGFCACSLYQPAVLADGRYEISNAGQLFWFAALVNGDNIHAEFAEQNLSANGVLNADIVIPEDMDWTPMAASAEFKNSASTVAATTDKSYSGVFDGAGHKISNLNIRVNEKELTGGLFGAVTGTIKNLGIEDASFDNGGAYDGRQRNHNRGSCTELLCRPLKY